MSDDQRVVVHPLERRDPPMLGEVMIRGRLALSEAGVVYAGQLVDQPVAVVMLTEEAESDSFGRARFDAAVQTLVDHGDGVVVAVDRDTHTAPWVALTAAQSWDDALGIARRVLTQVTLDGISAVGVTSGPDYRPHSYGLAGAGGRQVWPLPWPGSRRSAGRWTFIAAFGLMLAIAALALWIATRVFDTQPPAPPPPQITRRLPPPLPMPLPNPSASGPASFSPAMMKTGPEATGRGGTAAPIVSHDEWRYPYLDVFVFPYISR